MHVKNENYLVIQGWMINELNLTRLEVNVYANIYGLSQGGENSFFTGSRAYLAEWAHCSLSGLDKVLKSLVSKGLLIKKDYYKNNVKYCMYKAIDPREDGVLSTPVKGTTLSEWGTTLSEGGYHTQCGGGTTLSVHNNIDIYTRDKVSKKEREKKPHTQNGHTDKNETYNDVLDQRNLSPEVKALMIEFIKMRKLIKKPMSNHALKIVLTKLEKLGKTEEEKIRIIENSIENSWSTFYPLKSEENKPKHSNSFHNFKERDNDYDELQKKLLGYDVKQIEEYKNNYDELERKLLS